MSANPRCPECRSAQTIKNGTVETWKARKKSRVQMYRCRSCGRQFRALGVRV